MISTCPSCGGPSMSVVGEYNHRMECPRVTGAHRERVSYPIASSVVTEPVIPVVVPPPIPADGALHRCYCGTPIWFGALYNPRPDAYPQPDRVWRETDGTPHRCPKEGRNG